MVSMITNRILRVQGFKKLELDGPYSIVIAY